MDFGPPSAASVRGRFPQVDGLRTIAAGLIFIYHAAYTIFPGGFIGVDIFFAISGFLITRLLTNEIVETGRISLPAFYLRRAFRIMPALIVCVLTMLILFPSLLVERGRPAWVGPVVALLSAMNIWRASGMGGGVALGHTWTLSMEEQFYLVWALVVALLATRPKLLLRAAIVGIVATTIWRLIVFFYGADTGRIYNAPDTRADALLFGCALALLPHAKFCSNLGRLWGIPVIAGIGFVFLGRLDSTVLPVVGYSAIAVFAVWVLIAALEPGNVFHNLLGQRWIAAAGKRSYSFYLWHYPLLGIVQPSVKLPWPMGAAIAFVITLALAEFSYRAIELPFVGLGRSILARPARQREPVVSASGSNPVGSLPANGE